MRTVISSTLYLALFVAALYWANSKIIACEQCTATVATILGKPPFTATAAVFFILEFHKNHLYLILVD